jgi:tetratricopeptide (TPR) repeat protein/glycosyltransferase involved in cell wall biosynthesis
VARLSLCMIVKNEEANLPACLASAAPVVDDMVVVDTGSMDRTREVAAAAGARVFEFAWCDDFGAARNESLRHAAGDWILWLDGDERFDDDNRRKLAALKAALNGDGAAFVMKQRSGAGSRQAAPTLVDQVRLFRNLPHIRWEYRVHEQILMAVRRAGHEVRFTDIAIDHTGYEDPALRRRKTERNLRLLLLEKDERPDDPFTLFNLGWTFHELGEVRKAMPILQRSLERSRAGDSITRKLYALLTQGHLELGQPREALAVCRAGKARCPDDAELLFMEGALLRELNEPAGAEACLRRLLEAGPATYFASLDTGLFGFKTRHQLALLYRGQGRWAEAEAEWQAAAADLPAFVPAWQGLAEIYLAQRRWDDLDQVTCRLGATAPPEAVLLQARAHLLRGEAVAARALLEPAVAEAPQALRPRVLLAQVLLHEGTDPGATEQTLRAVVHLEPRQAEAWRDLALLLWRQGRRAEALAACQQGRVHCPQDVDLLFHHGHFLCEEGTEPEAAEACLLRFLEIQPPPGSADEQGRQRRATARHGLATVYLTQGRLLEAEGQWRAVLVDRPNSLGAWLGLADALLERGCWTEVEEVATRVGREPQGAFGASMLRARAHLARREFDAARDLLNQVIASAPRDVWPRVVLTHVLLQAGEETAAERALRDVLALAPGHPGACHNLEVLLRRQGRPPETVPDGRQPYRRVPAALELAHTSLKRQRREAGSASFAGASGLCPAPDPSFVRQPLAAEAGRLRIGFACYSPLEFDGDRIERMPLGGSESGLCYLAEALAAAGHVVYLFKAGVTPACIRGVHWLPLADEVLRQTAPLDALVVQNLAGQGPALRTAAGPEPALVLWTEHALDQPAVQRLQDSAERDAYDGFAFVSDWQRLHYVRQFAIDPERTGVLRNGIAPAFRRLFAEGEAILPHKARPPVLAYTSTPYRGLSLLLDAFPRIRAEVPDVTLKVFSSLRVYQVSETEEQARFGPLYERCRETPGVEYIGSVPQPELAGELRSASVLAYPNTYPETSCIAVLEAMAAGCWVVTSRQGALPETTAGFAWLIPVGGTRETYLDGFVRETVQVLRRLTVPEARDAEDHLRRQVDHVFQTGAWPVLARQWAEWFSQLRVGVAQSR